MVFNFQPFVKNVLVVIPRELITGNVYGLIKKHQLKLLCASSCCLLGLSVALGRVFCSILLVKISLLSMGKLYVVCAGMKMIQLLDIAYTVK